MVKQEKPQKILKEILDSGDFILIDGSIKGQPGLTSKLYKVHNYDNLDKESLRIENREMDEFREILKHPNTYTIEEVRKEIKKKELIIGEKVGFLNQNQCNMRLEKHDRAKRSLKELQEKLYALRNPLKLMEVKHKNPGYYPILEMIKLLTRNIRLKKDQGYIQGLSKINRADNSDTDEKLVATAYYSMIFLDKSPAILSVDRDFKGLLAITTRLLGADQRNIIEEFDFPKSKVTRILDKLEYQDLVERKRRGMSNIIFLK